MHIRESLNPEGSLIFGIPRSFRGENVSHFVRGTNCRGHGIVVTRRDQVFGASTWLLVSQSGRGTSTCIYAGSVHTGIAI